MSDMTNYHCIFHFSPFSLSIQACAKYIGNLLGFNENLDLKEKFNTAFWVLSTR